MKKLTNSKTSCFQKKIKHQPPTIFNTASNLKPSIARVQTRLSKKHLKLQLPLPVHQLNNSKQSSRLLQKTRPSFMTMHTTHINFRLHFPGNSRILSHCTKVSEFHQMRVKNVKIYSSKIKRVHFTKAGEEAFTLLNLT